MATLTDLANRFGSDKGTKVSFAHKYTYLYDLLFWPLKDAAFNFLELGLAVGGPETSAGSRVRTVGSPSVAMWLGYFAHAKIHGFDISDFSHLTHERFAFLQGDAGRAEDLRRLALWAAPYDIIVDDASHASYHQQLSLKMLWPALSAGGLYIIEDLHWQSPVFEAAMPKTPLTRDLLCRCFEAATFIENAVFSKPEMEAFLPQVASFAAFPAFNAGANPSQRLADASAKVIVLRKG